MRRNTHYLNFASLELVVRQMKDREINVEGTIIITRMYGTNQVHFFPNFKSLCEIFFPIHIAYANYGFLECSYELS